MDKIICFVKKISMKLGGKARESADLVDFSFQKIKNQFQLVVHFERNG